MSRQIGSLQRSNSHPANLQNPLPIIPLFAFPPPDSPKTNTSTGINSETNSDITIYKTISQFNNSDIETLPDKENHRKLIEKNQTVKNSFRVSKLENIS